MPPQPRDQRHQNGLAEVAIMDGAASAGMICAVQTGRGKAKPLPISDGPPVFAPPCPPPIATRFQRNDSTIPVCVTLPTPPFRHEVFGFLGCSRACGHSSPHLTNNRDPDPLKQPCPNTAPNPPAFCKRSGCIGTNDTCPSPSGGFPIVSQSLSRHLPHRKATNQPRIA